MAVGVLLFLIGLWIVLRTVRGRRKLPAVILGS
jgi:uncharacterized membrane protein YiaA